MNYTHIVKAYYDKIQSSLEARKTLDRNKDSVELAGFYASNLKEYEDYITFESRNAWGQITQSKILKSNIVNIEKIK